MKLKSTKIDHEFVERKDCERCGSMAREKHIISTSLIGNIHSVPDAIPVMGKIPSEERLRRAVEPVQIKKMDTI